MTSSGDTLCVAIRLHSTLRHRGGEIIDELAVELPQGSNVGDVVRLLDVPEQLDLILALNGQVVDRDAVLADGDRLTLIPALSGG